MRDEIDEHCAWQEYYGKNFIYIYIGNYYVNLVRPDLMAFLVLDLHVIKFVTFYNSSSARDI